MHESAEDKFRVFVEAYLAPHRGAPLNVLDVGSQAIGDAYTAREVIERHGWSYLGLDIEPGRNVDLIVADPYDWQEIADDTQDVVLCSQVLEHTAYPWRVVQEIARVLRPRGLAFLCAPSAGHVHRYPKDCYRYYPDGFPSLAQAAGLVTIESNVQQRPVYRSNIWKDASAVLQKPARTPVEAGHERARLELSRLSMRPGVNKEDLMVVSFQPITADPSPFGELSPIEVGALARRDAELASQVSVTRRLAASRVHFSAALKTLTRRI